MGNLTRKPMVPQIRCRAMPGGKSAAPFRYEVNVLGQWEPSNYQFARWVVDGGAQSCWHVQPVSEITMASIELVDYINADRAEISKTAAAKFPRVNA